jgi:hypothetical protein
VITLFKFGDDLCIRIPTKAVASNHGSLLEKEGYSQSDKHMRNQ